MVAEPLQKKFGQREKGLSGKCEELGHCTLQEVPVSLDVHSELKVSKVELRRSGETGGPLIVQNLSFEVTPFTRFGEALRSTSS